LQIIMEKRTARQLERIKISIERLTHATELEGSRVLQLPCRGKERLRFRVVSPRGDDLLDSYQGVLLSALENWTDDSLVQRLHHSCYPMVRRRLNKVGEAAPALTEASVLPEKDWSALPASGWISAPPRPARECPVCQAITSDIRGHLNDLRKTNRVGSSLREDTSVDGLNRFLSQLKRHISLREELQRLLIRRAIHRQNFHGVSG
jgi:hypothetical protein